jgi:hypothetical protein
MPMPFAPLMVRFVRMLMIVVARVVMAVRVVILYVGVWLVVARMCMPHRDAAARHRPRIEEQQLGRTESAEYSGPLTLGLAG